MSGFEEIKERQRRMWTVGDFPKIAERTVAGGRDARRAARHRRRRACPRRRDRDRQRSAGRRRARRRRERPRPDSEAARGRRRAGDRGRRRDRPRRGRRRGAPVRGRLLRRGHLDVRGDVRAEPAAGRRRARPRLPPGRADRGLPPGRRPARSASSSCCSPSTCRRLRRAFSRRSSGASRTTFAGCSPPPGQRSTCSLETIQVEGDSVEAWIAEEEQRLGPIILAREALEAEGRWPEVRAQLVAQTEAANRRDRRISPPRARVPAVGDRAARVSSPGTADAAR